MLTAICEVLARGLVTRSRPDPASAKRLRRLPSWFGVERNLVDYTEYNRTNTIRLIRAITFLVLQRRRRFSSVQIARPFTAAYRASSIRRDYQICSGPPPRRAGISPPEEKWLNIISAAEEVLVF